jgi:polyisoprenoid-binding protein YceI
MNVKPLIALVAAVLLSSTGHSADDYKVDPTKTELRFEIAQKSSSPRIGKVGNVNGIIKVDGTTYIKWVEVNIDIKSVDMGSWLLNGYVRNFLGATEYPQAVFISSNIVSSGTSGASVEGDFTLRGVSKPLQLKIDRLDCGEGARDGTKMCRASGTATLSLRNFEIRPVGGYVSDEVNITFDLKAYRQ